jgi:hypothetical protein
LRDFGLLGFNRSVVFALAAIKAARIAAPAGSVGFGVMEGLGMAAAAGCAFHDGGSIAWNGPELAKKRKSTGDRTEEL